ncbi:ATP synthase F0 sector subunit a [Alteracholeplasma palmae J233]|uniref:ATP synthase F0 sector subunit a n=1 Tax=Alteracholeplasma palmae (strain ATCC 49389 / J233) TaxID=1318466 RepID=U4KS86_ALTPJ|nr:FoF1 ATP synthase subunit a [Alteracholeplasma palmae]CCV64816.1 ATP synthase F0 sector subunit a [Alteracholeplasma palmae J233]
MRGTLFGIPMYMWTTIIIVIFVTIISLIVNIKIRKLKVGDKPSKFLTAFIVGIDAFNKFIKGNIGKHWKYVSPLVLTLAVTVFLSNISGLFALDTPTKYTTITAALALFSFFIVQSTGIVSRKWRHIKTLGEPIVFIFPLNLLSDFMPLLSMTLRLFGNIASGAVLVGLVYQLTGWFSIIVAPPVQLIFDIGFGTIQTLVFVMLTVVFSAGKLETSDLELEIN